MKSLILIAALAAPAFAGRFVPVGKAPGRVRVGAMGVSPLRTTGSRKVPLDVSLKLGAVLPGVQNQTSVIDESVAAKSVLPSAQSVRVSAAAPEDKPKTILSKDDIPGDDGQQPFQPESVEQAAEKAGGIKGLKARVGRILARVRNPFNRKEAELPAEWKTVREGVGEEIEKLRGMENREAVQTYLREVGEDILGRVLARYGSEEIGYHYNLNGGQASQYMAAGGIRAGRGDIAIQFSPMSADYNYKVYFFRSSDINLYDILNTRHPNLVGSRMGSVMSIFRLDSDYLKRALAEGGASKPTAISLDFDENWLVKNGPGGMVAIPTETFLTEPLEIFRGVKRNIGHTGRLRRDEETLAVMRYIEASLLP